jgi:3-oxoadipate enol-lactonase
MNVPPWLPPAEIVRVDGRGEVFVRVHRHADPGAPVLLLLHGWTASADTQFLYAYGPLMERYTVIAPDDHGHGRGRRADEPFDFDVVADDAAAVVRTLGFTKVTTVGYSMGGPVSMHLWHRHPELVEAMVFQATALEWRDRWHERVRWKLGRVFRPALRTWWYPKVLRAAMRRLARENPDLEQWVPWLTAEVLRNDPFTIGTAATALSNYDGREWAPTVSVPVAVVLTTKDRLVKPRKQRALAAATNATVVELAADHLAAVANPADYVKATLTALDAVHRAV